MLGKKVTAEAYVLSVPDSHCTSCCIVSANKMRNRNSKTVV